MTLHRKLLVAGLSVFSGLVLIPQTAQAALTANNGDIFVAFRSDGPETQSLLVDIGSQTLFSASGSSALTVNSLWSAGLLQDLKDTFGNNWDTRSDLHWSLFGTFNQASSVNFSSKVETTVGTLATAWTNTQTTAGAANGVSSNISAVVNDYKAGTGTTNNPTLDYLQTNSSATSSYSGEVTTSGKPAFGLGSSAPSGWSPINLFEGNFGAGTSGIALDLFQQSTSGLSDRGQFTINSNAVITFTPASLVTTTVPEPSRTLLGALGVFGITMRRRRCRADAKL